MNKGHYRNNKTHLFHHFHNPDCAEQQAVIFNAKRFLIDHQKAANHSP